MFPFVFSSCPKRRCLCHNFQTKHQSSPRAGLKFKQKLRVFGTYVLICHGDIRCASCTYSASGPSVGYAPYGRCSPPMEGYASSNEILIRRLSRIIQKKKTIVRPSIRYCFFNIRDFYIKKIIWNVSENWRITIFFLKITVVNFNLEFCLGRSF
jgi:hypothetical protein